MLLVLDAHVSLVGGEVEKSGCGKRRSRTGGRRQDTRRHERGQKEDEALGRVIQSGGLV